jgi:hypothetical protein
MKLELKKFDMRKVKPDSTCMFLGKRATGKSFALKDVLYHLRDLPMGIVISPTEGANKFFGNFIPSILTYEDYTPEIVAKFVDRQRKITDQYNDEKKRYGRTDIDPRGFLILDDCLYDKSWINDRNIRFLFMNGRHVHAFFAITAQYPLGIPPALRCNVDYVFICRENVISMREKIYKQFAGMFPTFDIFNQVMNACTQHYEILCIDNRTQDNALNAQVFWYKASMRDFKMCVNELWQIQNMEEERKALGMAHKNDDDVDDDGPDIGVGPYAFQKKNAIKLRVKKRLE